MPFPISFATIAETEAALGATFPAAFKLQMSRSNGGVVYVGEETWFLFPFRDSTSHERIRRTASDIRYETKAAIDDALGFPADGVAIAKNGGGDLLFLRREGARLRDEVCLFQLHGGEVGIALDDVAELWGRADDS
jgi:hypothetical protein